MTIRPSKRNIIFFLSVFLAWIIALQLYSNFGLNGQLDIQIKLSIPKQNSSIDFFYDTGSGYSESQKISLNVDLSSNSYNFKIPGNSKRLRIDPGGLPGRVYITDIEIKRYGKIETLNAVQLSKIIQLLNQVNNLELNGNSVSFLSIGTDPYIDLDVSNFYKLNQKPNIITGLQKNILYALMLSIASYFITIKFPNLKWITLRNYMQQLNIESKQIDNILILDKRSIIYLSFLAIIGLMMVIFKINQSSLGMYDAYFPSSHQTHVLAHHPLAIRSDEWLVQTPFILSQIEHGNEAVNLNIGGEKSPYLTAVPLKYTNFFQPKFWGFLFLDKERGFSWYWAYKALGILISFFILFLLLTKNNSAFSILGALLVYAANFTQWWYSSNYAEIIIAFCSITTSSILLLYATKTWVIITSSLMLVLFSVNFALHLYPAFLIPLFYLGVFIIVGTFFSQHYRQYLGVNFRLKIAALIIALGAIAAVLGIYFFSAKDTLIAIQNTVYPGKRFTQGGGLFWQLFTGFFDMFQFNQSRFPSYSSNVCEASNFYMFFLIAILGIVFTKNIKAYKNSLLISLGIYILTMFIWCIFGFNESLSYYTMMGNSSPGRSLIGIGIANIAFFIVFLSFYSKSISPHIKFKQALAIGLLFSAMLLVFGLFLQKMDPVYYSYRRLAISVLILLILLIFLFLKKFRYLISFILFISIAGFLVNPITYGMGGIYEKEVVKFFKLQQQLDPGKSAFFDSRVHPQLFKAAGGNIFGGTSYLPNFDYMKVLDKDEKYASIWNRYAHVMLTLPSDNKLTSFSLLSTDFYKIEVDPCGSDFSKLGIKYLMFLHNVDRDISGCAIPLSSEPINGIYFYKML